MGATCTICAHPEREGIDRDIVAGISQRTIARRWCVSRDAVQRHAVRHLSPALAAMQAEHEVEAAATLLRRTEHLIERTERLLQAAEQDGKVSAALAAVAQLRGLLELLGKVTGELKDQPVVSINLLQHPEGQAAIQIVMAELAAQPEIRTRIAERLQLEAGTAP